ncbi:ComF family protein [Aliiroseovarius crassostreae]|uniref:ComF family protein n=1 Tax=Aliiroseovarius crassostreae TaxID=154981 RepID=UPI003C7BF97B
MKAVLKKIEGNWDVGYALDKHIVSSTYTGDNEYGYPTFHTVRTEAGEAVYQLKYRSDWDQVEPLADAVVQHIVPNLGPIGLVIPVPASKTRTRQPVYEVAQAVAKKTGVNSFEGIVSKAAAVGEAVALKDLSTKEEKVAALDGRFTISDTIKGDGCWNALVVDDLFDTGASMEAVCAALRKYPKIGKIYVAALTWK